MPPIDYVGPMTGGVAVGGDQTISKAVYNVNMAGPDTGGIGIGGDFVSVLRTSNHATIVESGRENAFTTK